MIAISFDPELIIFNQYRSYEDHYSITINAIKKYYSIKMLIGPEYLKFKVMLFDSNQGITILWTDNFAKPSIFLLCPMM